MKRVRVVFQLILFIVLVPMLPLIISGNWRWTEGWLYFLISVLGFFAGRVLVSRRHPGLLEERAKFADHGNTESWDRILAPIVGLGGAFVPLIAGFDARFSWTIAFPSWVHLLSLLFLLSGFILSSWALLANRFFSGVVRIQTERNHQVVTTGPYRFIRHPGYTGGIMVYCSVPFLLDALSSLIPALLLTVILVIRTYKEDQTLQNKLEGYREYTKLVPYQLIPGVW